MYINGNLGQTASNTIGPGFGEPVDLIGVGLADPENQFLPNIPGTSVPVNIQPATTQLTNMLVYLAVAAALLMLYRRR